MGDLEEQNCAFHIALDPSGRKEKGKREKVKKGDEKKREGRKEKRNETLRWL